MSRAKIVGAVLVGIAAALLGLIRAVFPPDDRTARPC